MSPLIVEKLFKRWPNGRIALNHVSFKAQPGSLTAIIGPSGAGKSTLLKSIVGLYNLDSGRIEGIREQPIMVFQEDSLWPHLTLIANVTLPLHVVDGMTRESAEERARSLLIAWGLEGQLHAYPAELSGGQRQRGALARALVREPKVLCLDEITNGLDPETAADILESIIRLKSRSTIVLMATHQLNFARATADQVLFIDDGYIVEQGPAAQILSRPQSERIQRFISAYAVA